MLSPAPCPALAPSPPIAVATVHRPTRARHAAPWRARALLALLMAVLLRGGPLGAVAPDLAIDLHAHTMWTQQDGLPQDAVNAIAQTPDGYLWLGTAAGLVRFDGVQFEVFDRRNTDAIDHPYIRALHTASDDGTLWIGTDGGGLVRYQDGRFTRYAVDDGLPHMRVLSLAAAQDGGLWIGTYGGGVAHWRNGTFTVYGREAGLPDLSVWALHETDEGLWIGTQSGGVSLLQNGRVARVLDERSGLPSPTVYSILTTADDRLWVGTLRGIAVFDAARTHRRTFTRDDGLGRSATFTLTIDRTGQLWAGTYGGGVSRLRENGRFETFNAADGLSDTIVRSLYQDALGPMWIGTGRGLNRLAFSALTQHLNTTSSAFVQDGRGRRWVSTFNGLFELDANDRTARHLTRDDGLVDNRIWHAVRDRSGDLWIGTNRGAQRITSGPDRTLSTADGLPSNTTYVLFADPAGGLWIGTNSGVARFIDDRITRVIDVDDGLVSNQIRSIYIDRRGTLWIGTTGGLSRVVDPQAPSPLAIDRYTRDDGLPSLNIWSIVEHPSGDLWLGTRGGGLARLQPQKLASGTPFAQALDIVDSRRGLLDDNVCNLYFDGRGSVWTGTTRGILRLDESALIAVADGRQPALEGNLYDTADGLNNTMCASVGQSMPRSDDGRLWFPSFGGIVALSPSLLERNSAITRPLFETVIVDGAAQPLDAGTIALASDHRTLQIGYTALGSLTPHRLRFRYRLVDFDHDWQEVGKRRQAFYTNLPGGDYRFELSVYDGRRGWTPPIALSLTVRTTLHRSPLALTLAVLLIMGSGILLYHLAYRKRHAAQLQRAQADAAHHALQRQRSDGELARMQRIVAHDLRSPLTTIHGSLSRLRQHLGSGDGAPPEASHLAEQCRQSARVLDMRLEALMTLTHASSRVDAPQRIELDALIAQSARDVLGDEAVEQGLVRIEGPCPPVVGDLNRLQSALQTLIGRAFDQRETGVVDISDVTAALSASDGGSNDSASDHAHRDSGPCLVATIRPADAQRDRGRFYDHDIALDDGTWVVCVLEMRGVTLTPEQLLPVLDPDRTIGVRNNSRSSIRLAVVRRAIEAHGGWLRGEIEDDPLGRQSPRVTFTFALPGASPTRAVDTRSIRATPDRRIR
ncbi:MAG: two-component regulator propeller domain-containing protein [Acidobacteriota bacterium]